MAVTLLAAMLGGVVGGALWVPLGVIAPFWIVWTLPSLFGSAFASSMAYLVAGPAQAPLSRPLVLSLTVAVACTIGNLITGVFLWVEPFYELLPPGGQNTLFAESLVIGSVAGTAALRGNSSRRWRWLPFCVALLLAALAVVTLLYVGSAVIQVEFGPEPSVPEDRS